MDALSKKLTAAAGSRPMHEFMQDIRDGKVGNSSSVDTVSAAAAAAAAVTKPAATATASSTASSVAAAAFTMVEEESKPWEEYGWVPTTKSGKQKTPNAIRNQLQKYIDECKANGTSTQTAIVQRMGVNNNSFRRFMNPKTYKNPWSAVENNTYWAAARLLEEEQYNKVQAKKAEKERNKLAKKRKASDAASMGDASKKVKASSSTLLGSSSATSVAATVAPPKSKAQIKQDMQDLIQRIIAVQGVSVDDGVYDTCAQLVTKIKDFLRRDGMTKVMLLEALGNINSGSMNRFLAGKGQDQCGNVTYRESYVFFEKLRILEGKPKSKPRLKNEIQQSGGFSLVKERPQWYIVAAPGYRSGLF